MPRKPEAGTLTDLQAAVGAGNWRDAPDDVDAYVHDFRRLYHGATPLVLLPRDTSEVSRILAICHRDEVAVVPQGGNTGYCGGATPDESGSQIVLAMHRMNRVRSLDAGNYSMIIEAGSTLAAAQAAARGARQRVLEFAAAPGRGPMTLAARLRELGLVDIVALMAAGAGHGRLAPRLLRLMACSAVE